jgi:hypothetical protein
MADIFISHSSSDRSLAHEISLGLEGAGYSTWIYERDQVPGPSFLIQIGQAMERSRCVILIVSRDSLRSGQVTSEVVRAYEGAIPFLPLFHGVTVNDLQEHQPVWRQALATSEFLSIPAEGVEAILPFVIRTLEALGIRRQAPLPTGPPQRGDRAILTDWTPGDPVVKKPDVEIFPPFIGACEPSLPDAVHTAITLPESMAPGTENVADVWAFLESHRDQVFRRAREEAFERIQRKSNGPSWIQRGTRLVIRILLPGLRVSPSRSSVVWNGEIANATFLIAVPPGTPRGPLAGRVLISVGGLPITRLHFTAAIGSPGGRLCMPASREDGPRTGFASYANRDRPAVLARVQGLEKAGVDIFMDVHGLRSGDRYEERLLEMIGSRDCFYLFWSKAARESSWVEKEWRFALERRGIDYINPVPLVSPRRVPPPPELGDVFHFDDWMLSYLEAQTVFRPWWRFWRFLPGN